MRFAAQFPKTVYSSARDTPECDVGWRFCSRSSQGFSETGIVILNCSSARPELKESSA